MVASRIFVQQRLFVLLCLFVVLVASGASLVPVSAAPASQGGAVICASVPRSDWLSWLEVEQRLKGRGLRLVRLRINDEQCMTVLAIDGHGQYLALLMHPVSGDVLREHNQVDPSNLKMVPWKARKEP